MKNLKNGFKIQKVYPPSLKNLHAKLTQQGNKIRHSHRAKTRIDFCGNSLVLLVKEPNSHWTPASHLPNENSPAHQSSTLHSPSTSSTS